MLAARWILKGKAPCEQGEAFFGNQPLPVRLIAGRTWEGIQGACQEPRGCS